MHCGALFCDTKIVVRAWIADKLVPERYYHPEAMGMGVMILVDRIVQYCLANDYISEKEEPLLRYCVEKKASTFIVLLPLIILGITIQDYRTGLSFLFAFFVLRERTNGFHLQSLGACFVASILLEILILSVVLPMLPDYLLVLLSFLGAITIWNLAPYNHPDMCLSNKEVKACRRSSRTRLLGLMVTALVLWRCNGLEILRGMMMGISLVAVLLSLAYIIEWRNKHNEFKDDYQHGCSEHYYDDAEE